MSAAGRLVTGKENIMLLSEYIKASPVKKWNYTGTIWGSDPATFTRKELVTMLTKELPDFDGEIMDRHPDNGQFDDEGNRIVGQYYNQGDSIGYLGWYHEKEIVLIPA